MILSKSEIEKEMLNRNIILTELFEDEPLENCNDHFKQIAECSIDLHLGNVILKAKKETIDFKKPMEFERIVTRYGESFILQPNNFYLLCTKEIVFTTKFAQRLMLKSSIARNGIMHTLSGLVEPCFNDVITLEVTVTNPTIIYTGMPFVQVVIEEIKGEITEYNGQYVGTPTFEPCPSKIYKKLC